MNETQTPANDVELLPDVRLTVYRTDWERVQAGFVDRPRESVEAAADLVDRLVDELVDSFSRERELLENAWGNGTDDTEDLRLALQRYRSFFNRLLAT